MRSTRQKNEAVGYGIWPGVDKIAFLVEAEKSKVVDNIISEKVEAMP